MAREPENRDTTPLGGDPLTAELLDVLVADVRAVTSRLHELFEAPSAAREPNPELLTRSSDEARSIGWQLAVLASAADKDVLLARREAGGLGLFLELVRAALARSGRTLEVPARLPRIAPSVGAGWEVAWLVGAALYEMGRRIPPDARLAWSLATEPEGHALRGRVSPDAALRARLSELARCVPGATISSDEEGCTVLVPTPWLCA